MVAGSLVSEEQSMSRAHDTIVFVMENACQGGVEYIFYSKTKEPAAFSFKNRRSRAFEGNHHLEAERRRARTPVF